MSVSAPRRGTVALKSFGDYTMRADVEGAGSCPRESRVSGVVGGTALRVKPAPFRASVHCPSHVSMRGKNEKRVLAS